MADFAYKFVCAGKSDITSFQCNSLKICRCVLELYVPYHFRVKIAKLAHGGSQCTHLKKSPRMYLYIQILVWIYFLPSTRTRNVMERRKAKFLFIETQLVQ